MLYLCDLCGLARKIPRDSCSSLAKPYGFFSQSRRVYWAAELLLLRIRERRETFGLEGSSQRCTNTVLALSPQPLHIDRRSLCSLLIRPKALQRSQPLTRIICHPISPKYPCKCLIINKSISLNKKVTKPGNECFSSVWVLFSVSFFVLSLKSCTFVRLIDLYFLT